MDERYIKKDGKPIFLIYKAATISVLGQMLEVWNQLAKENGLKGIYVIGSNADEESRKYVNAELVHEPQATLKSAYAGRHLYGGEKNVGKAVSYDEARHQVLSTEITKDRTAYYRGKYNAKIYNLWNWNFGKYCI